ncbi:MAG: response regulator transcription factor [Nitrosospira sp.]
MKPAKTVRVLIAEDHPVVRRGLCSLLTASGNFTIVGEARNGREAVQMARSVRPDVILMDLAMPLLNGLQATRQIIESDPSAKILIISAHSDDVYVDNMIESGAIGFLEKHTSGEIIVKAVGEAAQGKAYFSPAIGRRLEATRKRQQGRDGLIKAGRPHLTAREFEVLQLIAESLANKEIALELLISIKTVEKHRQAVMDKLNIHDTAGLTRYAISAGIIKIDAQLTLI